MPYSRRPNNSFYDDPPFKTNTSTWVSNFTVTQDRVLDHVRVRQPNTFKIPHASKNLIDPNVENKDGDNNPATNSSLRSGVAQAGALVYCTTPIINPPPGSCEDFSSSSTIRASDAQANDYFGVSVAISGDYAIVGADGEDSNTGAAYIFKSAGAGKWPENETQKLTASDGEANDRFGWSVAISGDYAIVGAWGVDDQGNSAGAAYIFTKSSGAGWTQTQKLFAIGGATGDYFGYSVAISGDYAIVGAYGDDDQGNSAGAAYIFFNDGSGNWTQTQKLLASDGQTFDYFGVGVAISGDYAIVGAWGVDDQGNRCRGGLYFHEKFWSRLDPNTKTFCDWWCYRRLFWIQCSDQR